MWDYCLFLVVTTTKYRSQVVFRTSHPGSAEPRFVVRSRYFEKVCQSLMYSLVKIDIVCFKGTIQVGSVWNSLLQFVKLSTGWLSLEQFGTVYYSLLS